MPAEAFSHPFLIADLSVLSLVNQLLGCILSFILVGALSLAKSSLSFDLWPGRLLKILIPSNILCVDLVSGL